MTREAILNLFQTQLSNWLDRPVTVKEEDRLTEDLNLDSLDKIELWMYTEDNFKIDIPEEEINKCVTIKDVIDLVMSKGV